MKTRAAVCRTFGAPLTVETVDLAEPGPGEVLIKTAACAICHSDIFYMDGAWGGELPAVYGHEAAGVVEAVGAGVTRLKAGDQSSRRSSAIAASAPPAPRARRCSARRCSRSIAQSPLADSAGKPLVARAAHRRLRRTHRSSTSRRRSPSPRTCRSTARR